MKKPPIQKQKYCLNCHYPLPPNSKFCYQCRQKVTDGRITFSEIFREFVDAVFNWDSRFFQTLGALFIPGKLTTEYFKGRHRRFVHPLRVFLVMTLAMVAVITFSLDDDIEGVVQFGNSLEKIESTVARYDFLQEMDSVKQATQKEFNNPQVTAGLDTLFNRMMHGQNKLKRDSIELDAFNFSSKESLQIATDDVLKLTVNEVLDKYNIEGYWRRMELGQELRLRQNNQNFGLYLLRNISWMIFIMMPFLALVLKLLYVRRGYFYVEHLIFSFHTHAFVFLVYIAMILLSIYEFWEDWIVEAGMLIICGYLYFAMYRVYQQNWVKTLGKYILVGISYLFILIAAMFMTFIISFALF